jgi:transposase
MPLGAVVAAANVNDGLVAGDVLGALVVAPDPPTRAAAEPDARAGPTAVADGAYNNRPTRGRAQGAGFRLRTPKRGRKASGLGRIRNPVERCHNFFAQFGRVARRFDRSDKTYLGWIQLAACVILIRSGFVR